MKIKKTAPIIVTGALLVSGLGATLYAQGQHSNKMPDATTPKMGMMCGNMMAGTKTTDAKLDALTGKMNAAKGNAKVEAMAAVINEMVAQRKMMHSKMQTMRKQMMGGGMMGSGMMGSGMMNGGMMNGGMMNGGMMGKANSKPNAKSDEHSQHH